MNTKMSKRQRDLKAKLMAAIAMLLVSSIMMVSTTYAWFTLSTAPEVTGITTAVGANGNLEMALLPTTGALTDITSTAGDGAATKSLVEKNVTWGNLVDLDKENNTYGLSNIMLYPSELNVNATGGVTSDGSMLKTPVYGADGRISELDDNTTTAIFGNNGFYPGSTTQYGVRAIGVVSGMTARELDYRNARAAANTAMGLASTKAAQSLTSNGSALAAIAVKKGLDSEASFSGADVANLGAIITAFETDGGILDQIEIAYMQYILGYAASSDMDAIGAEAGDAAYTSIKAKVEEQGATLASVVTYLTSTENNGLGLMLPTFLTSGITAYNNMVTAISTARTNYTNLGVSSESTHTWDDISDVVNALANADSMTVNGKTPAQVKENMQAIVDDVTGGKGLTVRVASGAGIYADVADQCGDYSASIRLEGISYGGLSINANARMETASTLTPSNYLVAIGAATANKAPNTNVGAPMPISDYYGYVIDMAFRTNAAESNLLLQVDPADRIYDQTGNEETMGHGSSMTFQATTTDFSDAQLKDLMKAIRIVFFNPDDGVIKAKAKLDANNAELGADGWTAKMYLYSDRAASVYYETATAEDKATDATVQLYVQVPAGTEGGEPTYTEISRTDEGYIATNTYYVKKTNAAGEDRENNTIMALTQNTAAKLSALVYLDGNAVDNGDVAATGSSSMTGSMNLQFASSANLVPMEYKDLHQGTPITNNTNGGTATNGTTITSVTVAGSESEDAEATGTFDENKAVTITVTGLAENETISSVSIGGTTVSGATINGNTVTFTYDAITAGTAVTVTVGSQG